MQRHNSVFLAIKGTGNQIKRVMAVFHPHCSGATTGMQHAVINYVATREDSVFQRDIEQYFNIRRSTATGILQLMEKNELIRREAVDHDMRLKRVVLTDRAIRSHRQTSAEMAELERSITKGIAAADIDTFFRVISQIGENIETILSKTESAQTTIKREDNS